jgi:CRP-like cAMP-binding protein
VLGQHGDARLVQNRILSSLPAEEFAVLAPLLRLAKIKPRDVLQEANRRIDNVYFIERGVASRMSAANQQYMETAIVGSWGLVGVGVLLGSMVASQRTVVHLEGEALRISSDDLDSILMDRPVIRNHFMRYVQSLLVQNAQSVACASQHETNQRLARWLLLASDRMRSNTLPVTHDVLAYILGNRRSGVTDWLNRFDESGLIQKRRGSIHILDRERLQDAACECYGIITKAYAWTDVNTCQHLVRPS